MSLLVVFTAIGLGAFFVREGNERGEPAIMIVGAALIVIGVVIAVTILLPVPPIVSVGG